MADTKLSNLSAASALTGPELFYSDDGAADVKVTATQIKTWTSASPVLVTPNIGTPSAGVATNLTGTASGLTAGNVTTNANLSGPIASVSNTTSITAQTGTGTTFAMSAGPTFTGTAGFATISATGVIGTSSAGTNSAPALALNTGLKQGFSAADTNTVVLGTTTGGGVNHYAFNQSNLGLGSGIAISWANSSNSYGTWDLYVTRAGAAILQHGAANAASPVAQTLQSQGSRSGTDSNVGGGNLTITSGNGTGTGTVSSLILQSPVAAASGTGAQTQTTGLVVKVGTAVLTSYTVANLPAAGTAGAGATAFVTDASTTLILGLGGTVTGGGANKVPVFSDGTNWIYG